MEKLATVSQPDITREFYQLGGHRGHTNSWGATWDHVLREPKDLAWTIAGPDSPLWKEGKITLILGMKLNGTIALLLPRSQMYDLLSSQQLPMLPIHPKPFSYTLYASLSPIQFSSVEQLELKLKSLQSKAGSSRDTSRANKGYEILGAHNGAAPESALRRIEYEHARTVWHVLLRTIPLKDWAPYGTTWTGFARIVGFTWNIVELPSKKKELLDVGWFQAKEPSEPNLNGDARHVKLSPLFRIPGMTEGNFKYGTTESLSSPQTSAAIIEDLSFSSTFDGGTTALLVHDAPTALRLLSTELSIDISTWEIGVSSLLGYPSSRSKPVDQATKSAISPTIDPRKRPHQRLRSNSRIHILALDELYETIWQNYSPHPTSLPDIFDQLLRGNNDERGWRKGEWCAGNEAVSLYHAFQILLSGTSSDEFVEQVLSALPVNPKDASGASAEDAIILSSDDDQPKASTSKVEESGDWWDEFD